MNLQKYWKPNSNAANKFTWALFIVYVLALLWILILKLGIRFSYMGDRAVNLIPFGEQLFYDGKMDTGEVILNVVVFVPLGIYAGVLFGRWSFGKKLFFFSGTSLLVEVIQYILAVGAFDVTDIINNTLGGIVGLLLFTTMKKVFKSRVQAQKYINVIAATGTGLIVLLLLLLKLDLLPVRYR